MNETKKKLPNWKKWGDAKFLPWHLRNPGKGISPPEDRSKEGWAQWGETIYRPWYSQPVANSNPVDNPPPPPGPVRP